MILINDNVKKTACWIGIRSNKHSREDIWDVFVKFENNDFYFFYYSDFE